MTEMMESEFVRIYRGLSPAGKRSAYLMIRAMKVEQTISDLGLPIDSRKAVRARLLGIEEMFGGVSLRDLRGKLRRGQLAEADLDTLAQLGFAPLWVLHGDNDALSAQLLAVYSERPERGAA